YSLARDCGTNDRLLSIFNRLRPTRGLLSYDQSAVVQGGLDGDLSPCQNRLQCLFGRAASRRPELSAIAQHAAGVDYHGRGGTLDAEEVCRSPARIEDDWQRQPLFLEEGSHTLGCLVRVCGEGDHGDLILIVLEQLGKVFLHMAAAVARRAPERK